MKIKEKFYNLFNTLKKSLEKFPLTLFAIIILTLIYMIAIENDFIKPKTLGNISIFTLIFASSTFLIETLNEKKIKNNIFYYFISAFLSLIFTIGVNLEGTVLGMPNGIFLFRLVRLIACYVITIIVLGIYYNYKKSNKSFEEYLTKTAISLFKATLVYGILSIGIALVTAVFIYLILSSENYILILRMEVLLLGIYYAPTILYAFYKPEDETGKFAKIVIKYVLGTLVIAAFAIIYMYIIKIILLRNMPSNQIFRILSALFIIGLPIWTMAMFWKEGGVFDKIILKLPLLFIPFIFLQIYAIGVRIIANGITEPRYLCLMLVLFEIIYTILYLKNKEKIANILYVFILLTIISTIVPYVNMFNISRISQYNNLKSYYEKQELTEKEKTKIYGAYNYLRYSVEGNKYIENLTEEEKDEILSFRNITTDSYDNTESIYVNNELEFINVDGYNRLYNINSINYSNGEKNRTIDETFKNITFEIETNNDTFNVNILSAINECISFNDNQKYSNSTKLKEIIVDNNRKIILKSVSLEYDKTTSKVNYYYIYGYLLER